MTTETETPQTETTPETNLDSSTETTESEVSLINQGAPEPEPFNPETFSAPEGLEFSETQTSAIAEIAAKHKLSSAAVSDFLNLYAAEMQSVAASAAEEISGKYNEITQNWQNELVKSYGNREKIIAEAQTFAPIIDKYGSEELREVLNMTGAGNAPAVFRFFAKIRDALGESAPLTGAPAKEAPKSPNFAGLYPNTPSFHKGN